MVRAEHPAAPLRRGARGRRAAAIIIALFAPTALGGCVAAVAPAAEVAGSIYRGGVFEATLEGPAPVDAFKQAALFEGCVIVESRAFAATAECVETNVRIEGQALDESTLRLRGAPLSATTRALSLTDATARQTEAVAAALEAAGFTLLSAERRRLAPG